MDTRKTLITLAITAIALALGAAAVAGTIGDEDKTDPLQTEDNAPGQSAPASDPSPANEDGQDTSDEEPSAPSGILIDEHEASVSEDIQTGTLDLRVDHGHVQVIGWDKPAYHVMILKDETPEHRIEDYETDVTFSERTNDQHLDLHVIAERSGTHSIDASDGIQTGDDVRLAIIAYVPDSIEYDVVYACSGQNDHISEAASNIPSIFTDSEDREGCVPASETPEIPAQFRIQASGDEDRERVDRFNTVTGIHAETIIQSLRFGDIHLSHIDAEDIFAMTRHGDVTVEDARAQDVIVQTRHGDVTVEAATANLLSAETRHGNIQADADTEQSHLTTRHGNINAAGSIADLLAQTRHGDIELTPTEVHDGQIVTETRHGSITLIVPDQPDTGYSAKGISDYGTVTINLQDMETVQSSDEDESYKHAETRGYDDKAVQFEITSQTRHGDIHILEGTLDASPQGEEEEDATNPPSDELLADSTPMAR